MAKIKHFKLMETGEIRTRFAPSPTGLFHIGGARTALFNYLFAKQNKGSFVIRIEDTDIERSKPEFEKDIIASLKWLGIEWTEGPDINDGYGPYRQSERVRTYKKYLKQLLAENKAYYCFCSPEELEAKRQDQMARGQAPKYDGKCSSLSVVQIKKNIEADNKSVIRLRVHEKKIVFNDVIRGKVEFDTKLIGDFVIAKDLQTPLFYLAGAIDDYEMKISHIIRGEEHISNTPKQILIQEALGFHQPIYGHIPLILAPDRSKLSKRHGAVAVLEYKKAGYLPEALVNFLAFLGWIPGGEREIFSLSSLVKEFSLENVQKAGAVFNQKRLDFLNGFYIRQKSIEKVTELCLPYLIEAKLIEPINNRTKVAKNYKIIETGEKISYEFLGKIIGLYQTRIKKLSEITDFVDFFFKKGLNYPKELLKWQTMVWSEVVSALSELEKILSGIKKQNWNLTNLQNILLLEAERLPNRGYLLWPFRVALTGKESSAGPFEVAEILGKEKVLQRIKEAKEKND
ncbi:glutamate--tRNA ligase [Candidatus Parcubacteria bacterium]|nr:glutamate--tRNA ligase [Candidatus Parcubacteria bacterium]